MRYRAMADQCWRLPIRVYLFVSTVCDGQLKWICASGERSTVFDVPLNGRFSPVGAGYEQLVSTVYAEATHR